MVLHCAVNGCSNKSNSKCIKSFFRIPSVIVDKGTKTRLLSQLRQQAWLVNLGDSHLKLEKLCQYRICSDHFVQGKPCTLLDTCNPNWVPTLNLNNDTGNHVTSETKLECSDEGNSNSDEESFVLNCKREADSDPSNSRKKLSKHESYITKEGLCIPISLLQEHNLFVLNSTNFRSTPKSKSIRSKKVVAKSSRKKTNSRRVTQDSNSLRREAPPRKAPLRQDHTYAKPGKIGGSNPQHNSDSSDTDSSRTTTAVYPFFISSSEDRASSSSLFDDTSPDDTVACDGLFIENEVLSNEECDLRKSLSSSNSIVSNMEVIDLSDDDIVVEEIPRKKPSSLKRPFRCLNSDCRTEKDLIRAKDFVRRHFGVLPYPKKRRVCLTCFDEARKQQNSLVEAFESGRLLLAEKLPPPKTTVVLTDSDSDPSDYEHSPDGSELEFECDEGKTLEETIENIFTDLHLENQVTLGISHLSERLKAVEDSFDKLHAEDYASIEKELDQVRKEFYDNFRPEIMWLPALDIGPSTTVIHQHDGTSEVIAESSVYTPTENLPPVGPLNRYELKPNEMCYSMKYSLFARWVQAQVIEVEKREPKNTLYKIRYNRNAKGSGLPRVLPGRQLAYIDKCPTRIPVGTRVIAKYKDEDPKNSTISGSFYVGVVAEIPTAANKYRYLIFFDDGYAQYVHHNDIRVVIEASSCPWEDVSSDSREFIKEYLQMYPERPMVRLQKHNFVRTEWNGRWWRAQVMEVDGSLVRMFFPTDGRSEWIYRGSTRLGPLFNKKLNIQNQAEQFKTIRRRTAALPGRAVVEYGTFGQGHDLESTNQGERRAVAKKSTMSRAGTPPRDVQIRIEQESRGFTNKHALQEKIMKYQRHMCSTKCLGPEGDSMLKHKDVSPLLYPILQGWNRLMVKQRRKTITRNEVFYVAPCGLRLRNIEEIFQYIVITESSLEIDCFSFEVGVDVSHEWEPFKRIYFMEDLTKGEENVKISCVNSLDDSGPLPLTYCNVRLPTECVPLNLDQDFLVCCDCIDNCQDKDKCACRQVTIQGTRILDKKENPTAGYQHRRLYDQVQSGIYECNSRCKCAPSRCSNRVVQHPLRLKLQLFKTARRGWGVRTLCDIPRGGFICVYVGKMLSESIANEEGKQMIGGDDYYAELDYIEVMENAKEGYEEEAVNPEDESLSISQRDTSKSPILGSDLNDSDGFFSENEVDNPSEDRDFSQPSYHKNDTIGKREKSARLQERLRGGRSTRSSTASREGESEPGSAAPSDDESNEKNEGKSKDGDKKGSGPSESVAGSCEPSEDEDADDEKQRRPQTFLPSHLLDSMPKMKERKSVREYFGKDESVYIMDAKHTGNIGRYLNHACEPNVFVQNVFVDTHDLRFPWVAFFSIHNIRAGTELTWDYNYEVDSVPGKVKYCYCGARKCRGRLL